MKYVVGDEIAMGGPGIGRKSCYLLDNMKLYSHEYDKKTYSRIDRSKGTQSNPIIGTSPTTVGKIPIYELVHPKMTYIRMKRILQVQPQGVLKKDRPRLAKRPMPKKSETPNLLEYIIYKSV